MKNSLLLVLFLVTASCWGQDSYTLPLAKANTTLSLPAMTAGSGVLYEAHRSFDLLRFSNQLQVSAYDLATHKELRHTVMSVPRVHGARAAEGLFLSPDGATLVYAEIYEPMLLIVLSAKIFRKSGARTIYCSLRQTVIASSLDSMEVGC